jgi:sialate O-acetylesterase
MRRTSTVRHRVILVTLLIVSLIVSVVVAIPSQHVQAAALALGRPFTNNAVLQRNMPVPVFGTGTVGTTVSVSFNGQHILTNVGSDGKWRANLTSMAANTAPGNMVITSGSESITLTGLQIGEVWLCSGQSNMKYALSSAIDGAAAASDAPNHNIRLFMDSGPWQVADATTAGNFSAICYWFGHELSTVLSNTVPIGLIQEAVGGTSIAEWETCCGSTRGATSGAQYNSWIVPLQPYAIRGVNWYQGENDAHFSPDGYYIRQMGLINEWRAAWGQGNFHFQIGQLHWNSADEGWASVRQDQLQAALDSSNAALAVNVDAPPGGGHPPAKKQIGVRFGLAARALVYGEAIEYSGPIPSPSLSSIQGNQFVIGFTHVGNGLVTGSEFQPGGAPVPFKLAGTDGVYYSATGQIVGNTVVVTSASVPNPVSVEYVWDISQGNLYNNVNIPSAYGPVTRLPAPSFKLTLAIGPFPTATPIPPTPTVTPTPGSSALMHVADIYTSDVNGNLQTTFSAGTTVYWRVKIVDESGSPVSGAAVTTVMLKPDGTTWNTQTVITNSNGWAIFSKSTQKNNAKGTYTINVTNVVKSGAIYNSSANVKSSTTFILQ